MKFANNTGGPIKIRIGNSHKCYWKTIRKGDVVELSPEKGRRLGLTSVTKVSDTDNNKCKPKLTEGQIGDKKVETKQIDAVNDTDDFFKELCSIKGIGKETAEDIIRIFPKSEDLKNKIHKMETLPFRENICIALNKRYSK